MFQKYTALFLVFMVAASAANTVNLLQDLTLRQFDSGDIFQEGLSANVNHYIDETLSLIVPFIQRNGLDPMPLPNVREGFQVRPLWVTYSAWLNLYEGQMSGLVNVARSGDQKVSYNGRNLSVRIQLEFTNLEFVYKYLVQVMGIGPSGGINGSLNRFIIVFDLLLDFNVDEIHVQDFRLINNGNLRVRLTGNWLTDWLVNPVVSLFVRIFNSTILNTVQSNIRNLIQSTVDGINSNLRQTIERLESYNYA
ncbi:unnamed protein product [Arctia plantaginis]|uniref:Uncharacterized protein n=1 Tax=Arctia plantaginis TaxID=874455 RepID=A0A8S1BC90_ARCPL|nr:unnamed protein product [Arctia plantaginis]CAB3255976.1 unnamed protein product [Arctia plantaginis]